MEVPDPRLTQLVELVKPKKKVPAVVEFVDIAGLVKGASQGEGLGNQFLSHIREVDAIVHVIRCFEDPDVVHVMGPVDPVRDHDVISAELALADVSVIDRRIDKTRKSAKSGDKDAQVEMALLDRVTTELNAGRGARAAAKDAKELAALRGMGHAHRQADSLRRERERRRPGRPAAARFVDVLRKAVAAHHEEAELVPFSAKLEAELAELSGDERKEFLASAGVQEPGLDRLIHAGYALLGLRTYFTAGEQEVRAWTIHVNDTAYDAAGVIHSDFQKGFIRAETLGFADFIASGGWKPAREQGRVRSEGREYVVQDGDVLLFRFNV